VVLRELRDFSPVGATGSENCWGKWRKFFIFRWKRNGEAQLVAGALIVECSDSARGAETQIPQINSEIPATDGARMHTDKN